eukprot:Nitzschia sp. Nitz4//scaffold359_size15291//13345//13494//NITZ4_008887-RA/size15291-exonerate_est2genome-gene-0.5-mRNA-1//1//CDS//3329549030//9360//frame0
MSSVQELYLSHNAIGDKGAVALAGALRGMKSLQFLFLIDDDIGNEGAIAL